MQIGQQVKRKMIRFAIGLSQARPRLLGTGLGMFSGMLCLICVLPIVLRAAQDLPPPPLPVDPTPLAELLSAIEKSQFNEVRGHKKEVDFYVKVAEAHLEAALSSIKNGDYRTSERELDIYRKAMSEALKASASQQDGRRSLSKKIEQNLYKQIKTLEAVEILFPIDRQAFATAAMKHAKQLRVQALNAAFASGDTLKDPDEQNKPKTESPIKDGSLRVEKSFGSREPARGFMRVNSRGYETRMLLVGYALQPAGCFTQIPNDYLTEAEDDKVREAQSADARAKVFMKIADRRISLITAVAAPVEKPVDKKDEKSAEEEEREWGVLKTTSKAELLKHYSRAIEECMAKIEDAYERNPKSKELPTALATLREATDRHLQALRSLANQVSDEGELRALRDAIEQAELANKGAREGLKK